MIIWIASYPKSGNTYLRSFIASYFFSKDGKFNFDDLLNIQQFPNIKFSKFKPETKEEASKSWIFNQNNFFDRSRLTFLKTHNSLLKYSGNKFTSKNETIGGIYIVRDPRNIVTSLTHHYSLSYKDAIGYMIDKNSGLMDISHNNDHSNFTFLSSWSNHYTSWLNHKEFEVLFIKYEDLEDNKTEIFSKIINFINKLIKNNHDINERKLLNSIKSTNFNNLKNKELNEGFEESVYSKITGKKINFFNLGFNNRWQKILPNDIKDEVNLNFAKDIKYLKY
tara:strand:- start:1313 stop:2149 length:837 start_codon:yes stop_codon:yes gene_type:complete